MESIPYRPSFQEGMRVMLAHDEHRQHRKAATVMGALPNPSRLAVHQWYDIRFDDGTWGRFLERHLQDIPSDETDTSRVEDQSRQSSVA
jgi:hypothetical protein